MKYVKMLGLAAVAAMALMAFLGAGTASATVLCSTNSNPCGAEWTYPANTKVTTSLATGTTATLKTTGGAIEDTCNTSTVEGNTANEGSSATTVSGSVAKEKLTFGGCTNTTDVLEGGELEIHSIAGTSNGTLTAKKFRVTINLGASCVYGAGEGTDLGTVTGGNPATMSVNATVNKVEGGFLCPSTSIWQANYTVTSPVPLFIAPS